MSRVLIDFVQVEHLLSTEHVNILDYIPVVWDILGTLCSTFQYVPQEAASFIVNQILPLKLQLYYSLRSRQMCYELHRF